MRFCRSNRVVRSCLVVSGLMALPGVVSAADVYPSRPIRMIVPFAPGGGSDLVSRVMAQKLSASLKQQVVVDNRSGGGGIIGTDTAAKATPDGYTILWGTSSGMVINPLLNPKLPYDVEKDLTPVSMVSVNPILLVVNNAVPAGSIRELIALAKAKPGALNYATPGYGSPVHLAMELFKSIAGIDIVHVPYKGAGPALTDVLAGQVHMKFNTASAVIQHIRAGRIKALAIGSAKRSAIAPDIPTMIEAGVPGFDTVTWYGLFLPSATPRPIVTLLNQHVVRVLNDPDVVQRMAEDGAEPRGTTPLQVTQYMKEEAARWKRALKNAPAN